MAYSRPQSARPLDPLCTTKTVAISDLDTKTNVDVSAVDVDVSWRARRNANEPHGGREAPNCGFALAGDFGGD